jgi:hypothetical protein
MKILIIEDTDYKAKSIQNLLKELALDSDSVIARSFQSGKRALKELKPELILLDMTIQTSERPDGQTDGRNRIYGGREILAEIEFLDLSARVIVITQFDHFGEPPYSVDVQTLFKQLRERFPKLFVGGVYYNNLNSVWMTDLRRLLRSVK